MRKLLVAAAMAAACVFAVGSRQAAADILLAVSKTSQRMTVLVDGTAKYNWVVSTGAKRYTTPNGAFKPEWMARKWHSRQYHNAPMPHSIFFYQGYAIHGTTEIKRLGKIASHGCVRLHPDNAATLFSLVQKDMANTRIIVSNDVIEAPGQTPKPKKPGRHVADNATGEEPAEAAKLETLALATQDADMTEEDPMAELAPVAENDMVAENERVVEQASPAEHRRVVPRMKTVKKVHAAEKAYAQQREEIRPRHKPVRERIASAHKPGFHW